MVLMYSYFMSEIRRHSLYSILSLILLMNDLIGCYFSIKLGVNFFLTALFISGISSVRHSENILNWIDDVWHGLSMGKIIVWTGWTAWIQYVLFSNILLLIGSLLFNIKHNCVVLYKIHVPTIAVANVVTGVVFNALVLQSWAASCMWGAMSKISGLFSYIFSVRKYVLLYYLISL